jgi:hypothetical protein
MKPIFLKWLPVVAFTMSPVAHAQFITVGPNVNVSRLVGNQTDTAIAINRANTSQIAVSANGGANGLFVAYSGNGGSSWNTSSFAPNNSYSSWMGADNYGNIYMSYLSGSSSNTSIARSIDGGANYSVVATLTSTTGFPDHPEMGIGPGPTAGTNSIFLRDTVGGANRITSATSSGLGVNTSFTSLSPFGTGNYGSTAVGPGGRTAFTVMNPAGSTGPSSFPLRYDADGVGPGGYVTGSTFTTQVGGSRPIPAQPTRTIDAQVALQYDSSGGPNNGSLYMLYTQAPNPTSPDTDIVLRRSSDNGVTFSDQVRVNSDTGSNSQFLGRLAVDQVTGNLASVWYDARNSLGNNTVELWGSVSIDGGSSWAPNFKISDAIFDGKFGGVSSRNFGDYISLDFYNGQMVTAWADSSNSTLNNPDGIGGGMDVYFSSISVTSAVPEPPVYVFMLLGIIAMGLRKYRR